ncbi:hypothetical protein CJ030_MR3G007314 [Morella rubra]|uniref:Transmembrane protein n=1 Tax=Morella rubra TaxID=262757 RepID=A0A6A1W149_9ROSI|nr:hypothetical protein CJ030_MR3G007314 [Morella rubra]
MKLLIFPCLILFLSCTPVLSSSARGSFSTLEHEGSNLSKRIIYEQKVDARLGAAKETLGMSGGSRDGNGDNGEQEIYDAGKNQRGKAGASGGSNIAHRPGPSRRSSASLSGRPRFFISTFMAYVGFGLILVFPFWLL